MNHAWVGLLFLITLSGSCAIAQEAASPAIEVTATHDARPFEYRSGALVQRAGYRIRHLAFPSPVSSGAAANDRVPARLYLPDGAGEARRPAVICLHILNGNFELTRMFCAALAERGVAAMWFPLPWYGERRGTSRGGWLGRPEGFSAALHQSVADIRRAHDLLASRPEVIPGRIGVAGISLGAVLAARVAAVDARFHRVCLIMGGGGLTRILAEARECRAMQQWLDALAPPDRKRVLEEIRAVDPLTDAEALRARAAAGRVLMINAGRDRVVRPERARALARAIGIEDSIHWLPELGHYTAMAALPTILNESVAFFAPDLPEGAAREPKVEAGPTPLVRLQRFVRELQAILFREPAAGRCRFVDVEVDLRVPRGPRLKGTLRWVRGSGGRFLLDCRAPQLGRARLGGTPALWLEASGKRTFVAVGDPESPLAFASRPHLVKLRVASGALAGITFSTAVLQQLVKVEPVGADQLALTVPGKGQGRLTFAADGRTPVALELTEGPARGRITFRVWNPDGVAAPELFEPAADSPKQEVPARDLARMISAVFNLGMEKLQ